jgi:hypothetical protein
MSSAGETTRKLQRAAGLNLLRYDAGNGLSTFYDALTIAETAKITKHIQKLIML